MPRHSHQDIERAVTAKLEECRPFYVPNDLVVSPYDKDGNVTAGPNHILRLQLQDIAETLGIELFNKLPAKNLFAFAVRAAERNDSTGELLKVLIECTIKAYGKPECTDQVVSLLGFIHAMSELDCQAVSHMVS